MQATQTEPTSQIGNMSFKGLGRKATKEDKRIKRAEARYGPDAIKLQRPDVAFWAQKRGRSESPSGDTSPKVARRMEFPGQDVHGANSDSDRDEIDPRGSHQSRAVRRSPTPEHASQVLGEREGPSAGGRGALGTRGRGNAARGRGDVTRGRGDSVRGRGGATRGRGDATRGRGDTARGRGDTARGRGGVASSRGDPAVRGRGGRGGIGQSKEPRGS